MIQCKICNRDFKNLAGLGSHINRIHNISKKDYYLQYINNVIPNCKNCGKPTNFYNLGYGFSIYCSCKCANSDSEKLLRWKLNTIEKYGVENTTQLESVKEKMAKTNLIKYGKITNLITDEQKIDTQQKLLLKYGVTVPAKSEIIRKRMENSTLKRFGVTNYSKTNEHKKRMIEFNKTHKYNHNKSLYVYNNLYFDSSWELAYYMWLVDNNIDFEYKPDVSFEYEYNEKTHKYYPDFLVNDEYVEIKGEQFFDKDGNYRNPYDNNKNERAYKKYQCMIKNDVKIIRYNEILQILNKYGKKYLKQFKCK